MAYLYLFCFEGFLQKLCYLRFLLKLLSLDDVGFEYVLRPLQQQLLREQTAATESRTKEGHEFKIELEEHRVEQDHLTKKLQEANAQIHDLQRRLLASRMQSIMGDGAHAPAVGDVEQQSDAAPPGASAN